MPYEYVRDSSIYEYANKLQNDAYVYALEFKTVICTKINYQNKLGTILIE